MHAEHPDNVHCFDLCTQDKDSALVDKDVLAVDVARCREALVAKVDEVLLVEHERAQLQESLEARRSAMAVGSLKCTCMMLEHAKRA